jgi:hypothetical protein
MHKHRSSAMHADRSRGEQMRRRIAVEAARLISEHGIRDYHLAKRKAAERLGVPVDSALPKNAEIEDALREHQRLFDAQDQPRRLRQLRESARDALQFFSRFEPRLVGAVLDGSADRHSAVCLHLFSDEVETVAGFLDERGIPYEEQSRQLRLTREVQREFPAFVFSAGETPVDVTVMPTELSRQAPLDRSGEKPMRRASLTVLEELLAETATDTDQRLLSG